MIKPARTLLAVASAALLLQLPTVASAQITAGLINDFEDGTTQGWHINPLGTLGTPPPEALPANVPTGGPTGADDNFLRLISVGVAGPGSRLTVISGPAWSGDYLAAGITEIRFDAINLGQSDLLLRFLLEDPFFAPPVNIAASTNPVTLRAGSGWQSLVFPLFGPNGLSALQGTLDGALRNATAARIFHSDALGFPPEPIAASVGLDNIRAVAEAAEVPEPSSVALLLVAMLALALAHARKSSGGVNASTCGSTTD